MQLFRSTDLDSAVQGSWSRVSLIYTKSVQVSSEMIPWVWCVCVVLFIWPLPTLRGINMPFCSAFSWAKSNMTDNQNVHVPHNSSQHAHHPRISQHLWLLLTPSTSTRTRWNQEGAVNQTVTIHAVRLPITRTILDQLHTRWEETRSPDRLAPWVTPTLFAAFFCLGELFPVLKSWPTCSTTLTIMYYANVMVYDSQAPNMLKVHLQVSKRNQFSKFVDEYLGRTGMPHCPMLALVV